MIKAANGHRSLHVCKDKQLLSRGSNLSLNEDTGEFYQEMIPKDIGRPSVAMATALLRSLKLWLTSGWTAIGMQWLYEKES